MLSAPLPNTWSFIHKEGPLDICWPAKGPLRGKETLHLKAITEFLKQQGFPFVRLHEEDINAAASFGGYYSTTDTQRALSLQKIIEDDTCQVIWAGAGGFGALGVLDIFEKNKFSLEGRKIRPIVGFSNITALHLWAAKHKWPSLHACVAGVNQETFPVAGFPGNQNTSIVPLLQALTGEVQVLTYAFEVLNPEVIARVPLHASVVGGNLSLVQRSQGSSTQLKGAGRFVFLEDTFEYFNRSEELLCSLARTGLFDEAKAIIFGRLPMVADEAGEAPNTRDVMAHFEKTILRERRGLKLPLLYSDQFGHGPLNHVLPFGTTAHLTFPEKDLATLTVHVNASAYGGA